MAAYTATNWTVEHVVPIQQSVRSKRRVASVKISIASGREVPLTGIPLPSVGQLGMSRFAHTYIMQVDHTTNFTTAPARSILWRLNATGRTIQAHKYTQTTGVVGAASGGRCVRPLATTVTLLGTNSFFLTVEGY